VAGRTLGAEGSNNAQSKANISETICYYIIIIFVADVLRARVAYECTLEIKNDKRITILTFYGKIDILRLRSIPLLNEKKKLTTDNIKCDIGRGIEFIDE